MIPMTLVTGFLGAGKTTLLSRLVEQNKSRRIAYLVNEFSPTDVDGNRLELSDGQLTTISGGSIFCRCKVTEFIGALDKLSKLEEQPQAVVIEASGIANPKVVAEMLAETRLDERFNLAQIVSVVDPETFGKLLHTLPNVRGQVEAADHAIINKADLHDASEIELIRKAIKRINEDVAITVCSHCQVQLDLVSTANRQRELSGEYAPCMDPNFVRMSVQPEGAVNWDRLKSEIAQRLPNVFRVKGFIRNGEGILDVDYAAGRWNVNSAPHVSQCGLVFIAPAVDMEDLQHLVKRIEKGEFEIDKQGEGGAIC